MLAHKSNRFILPPLVISLILLLYLKILGVIFLGFTLYLIWFFRDPKRVIQNNESLIFAAADGKIIYLGHENGSLKIGIRMSPFDVHINRAPISGVIATIKRTPGFHHNVYFGNIEDKNERNLINIRTDDIYCDVLQITGAFARRIECWIREQENVQQGQKIGMIRFGSQTNMYIDAVGTEKSIKPLINVGDKVYAGITAVAKIEVRSEK